ncbi:hypothetical protein HOG21_05185 [bacterium]|nr:hypothetical protein [bacterium]
MSEVITNGETITIETTAKAVFELKNNGIRYTSNGSAYDMNLTSNEAMGEYSTN